MFFSYFFLTHIRQIFFFSNVFSRQNRKCFYTVIRFFSLSFFFVLLGQHEEGGAGQFQQPNSPLFFFTAVAACEKAPFFHSARVGLHPQGLGHVRVVTCVFSTCSSALIVTMCVHKRHVHLSSFLISCCILGTLSWGFVFQVNFCNPLLVSFGGWGWDGMGILSPYVCVCCAFWPRNTCILLCV